MAKTRSISETPATHWLRQQGIPFQDHPYDYVDHGGAAEASRQLGVPLHRIAKTLIMEDEHARPLVVLMHGDCEVSTKNLARQTGAKKIVPCTPDAAQRHSGYQVGGTSPFATRKRMPVWAESTLLTPDIVYLNGGRRGFLISLSGEILFQALNARPVQVALSHDA